MSFQLRRHFLGRGAAVVATALAAMRGIGSGDARAAAEGDAFEVTHSDAEWQKLLSANQFNVLRQEGTERPFSSPLNNEHRAGQFHCAGCKQALFSSKTKFDSGTGWPSFWQPLDKAVAEHRDTKFGMLRREVHCTRCGGHLGHVFEDGPKPTGLRYCMNGIAMLFEPAAA